MEGGWGGKSAIVLCAGLVNSVCFNFAGNRSGWHWAMGVCQGTCQANEVPSTGDYLIMADGTGLCGGVQANTACG